MELGEYCRARHRLLKMVGTCKSQVRRNLSVVFLGYGRVFRRLFCRSSGRLLKEYIIPEAILSLGEERLAMVFREGGQGGLFGVAKVWELIGVWRRVAMLDYVVEPCV